MSRAATSTPPLTSRQINDAAENAVREMQQDYDDFDDEDYDFDDYDDFDDDIDYDNLDSEQYFFVLHQYNQQ